MRACSSISAIFPSQRRRPNAAVVPGPQACGAKNALAKDAPAKSGAEASDESILKKDLAAAKAPAAGTVDSDKAKADFWSKFTRPTGAPTAPTGAPVKGALNKDIPAAKSGAEVSLDETGVIKNDPALKPATKIATALKPAAAGGAPLPSMKEFPEEEPAPAASAWHSARRRLPTHSVTPSRVRRVGRRRLERLDQGPSGGDGRPGGEHLPAPFCAHAAIAGTRESYRRALALTL